LTPIARRARAMRVLVICMAKDLDDGRRIEKIRYRVSAQPVSLSSAGLIKSVLE